MRLKQFLAEMDLDVTMDEPNQHAPTEDRNTPSASYETRKQEIVELLDQINELIDRHTETQADSADKWSHASDLVSVIEKLQEIVEMLSPEEDTSGSIDQISESVKTFPRRVEAYINKTFYVFDDKVSGNDKIDYVIEESKKKYRITAWDTNQVHVQADEGSGATKSRARQIAQTLSKLAKSKPVVTEGTNHMGERTISNFSKWKSACKQINPNVWFDGDKDISQALIGPKPYKRGATTSIGEWDGETGTIYK